MKKISRRSFARSAAIAATAAAVIPAAIAQTPPAPAAPSLPPSSQAEVDARVQWIFTKYGSRLNDAERADIKRLIAGGQPDIDAMRAYAIDNALAPATPFRIYRKAAK